jgi:uncharacterized membrane protein YhaH (DUF805 family)
VSAPPVPSNQSNRELFAHPFSFKGRIRRLEFGLSVVISMLIALLSDYFILSGSVPQDVLTLGFVGYLYLLIAVIAAWFGIAQVAKRCHDIGISGWWQVLPCLLFVSYLLPASLSWIGIICMLIGFLSLLIMLVLLFCKGDESDTVYGLDPTSDSKISEPQKSCLIAGSVIIVVIILSFKVVTAYNNLLPLLKNPKSVTGQLIVPAAPAQSVVPSLPLLPE